MTSFRSRARRVASSAFVILCVVAADVLAARDWTFIDLGTLGGRTSFAVAVSNSGTVAGWSEFPRGPFGDRDHAVIYRNGALQDLGTATDGTGRAGSRAFAVNNREQVAGVSADGEAVVWQRGAVIHLGAQGAAFAINDAG